MSAKKIMSISDLRSDENNLNAGTQRGRHLLEISLRDNGAGRSILADAQGNVIAGNKTLEAAEEIGISEIIVVPTNGQQLVVVQRTDLDLTSENDSRAKMMAFADNRVAQLDLGWDAARLVELAGEIDLTGYISDDELAAIQKRAELDARDEYDFLGSGEAEGEKEEQPPEQKKAQDRYPLPIVLSVLEKRAWDECKKKLKKRDDKAALFALMEANNA